MLFKLSLVALEFARSTLELLMLLCHTVWRELIFLGLGDLDEPKSH